MFCWFAQTLLLLLVLSCSAQETVQPPGELTDSSVLYAAARICCCDNSCCYKCDISIIHQKGRWQIMLSISMLALYGQFTALLTSGLVLL